MLTGLSRDVSHASSHLFIFLGYVTITWSFTRSSMATIGRGILASACLIFTLSSDLRYTISRFHLLVFLGGKDLSGIVVGWLVASELGSLVFTASIFWQGLGGWRGQSNNMRLETLRPVCLQGAGY